MNSLTLCLQALFFVTSYNGLKAYKMGPKWDGKDEPPVAMAAGMAVGGYDFASSEWIAAMSSHSTLTITNGEGNTFVVKKKDDDITINNTTVTKANWESAVNGDKVDLGDNIELDGSAAEGTNELVRTVLFNGNVLFGDKYDISVQEKQEETVNAGVWGADVGALLITPEEIATLDSKTTIKVTSSEGKEFIFQHKDGLILLNDIEIRLSEWDKAVLGLPVELAGGQRLDGDGAQGDKEFMEKVKLDQDLIFGKNPTITKAMNGPGTWREAEAEPEPEPEPKPEQMTEAPAEPITEVVIETVTEKVTETVTEQVSEPVTEQVSEPVAEPTEGPKPVTESEAETTAPEAEVLTENPNK